MVLYYLRYYVNINGTIIQKRIMYEYYKKIIRNLEGFKFKFLDDWWDNHTFFRRVVASDVNDVGDRWDDHFADGALFGELHLHHTLIHLRVLILTDRVRSLLQLGLYSVLLFTSWSKTLWYVWRSRFYLFVVADFDRLVELFVDRKVHELSDGCGLGTWDDVLGGRRDVLHCWRTRRIPRVS